MHIKLTLLFTFLLLLIGCNSKKTVPEPAKEHSHAFFPVTNFIRGQLREIDSIQVTPLKIVTLHGKKDSSWIKVEDVKKFAAPFLKPEIDTSNLITLFTETSFMDQTLNAITLTYSPDGALPDSMTLRNWDIYVDPKLQTVQRVYIVKEEFVNGKAQMIQLTWKTGAWCKIVTIPDGNDNIADIKEVTVIWNFDK